MVIKIWHGSEKIIKKPMYNEGKYIMIMVRDFIVLKVKN